jgi:hypothetical protein
MRRLPVSDLSPLSSSGHLLRPQSACFLHIECSNLAGAIGDK